MQHPKASNSLIAKLWFANWLQCCPLFQFYPKSILTWSSSQILHHTGRITLLHCPDEEVNKKKKHISNRQPWGTSEAGPGRKLSPAVLSQVLTTGHLGEVQLVHASRIKTSINCLRVLVGVFFSLLFGALLPPGDPGKCIVQAHSARSLTPFRPELPHAICRYLVLEWLCGPVTLQIHSEASHVGVLGRC